MTDEETTTPGEVCPKCGKVHDRRNPRLAAALEKVDGFDAERQSLLLDRILMSLAQGVQATAQREETPPRVLADLAVLTNLVNLAGYTALALSEAHEDWTRTGDRSVNELFTEYLTMVADAQIRAEDLPEGSAQRLSDGTATEADYAAVRSLIEEKTGSDPGDISQTNVRVHGDTPDDDTDHYVPPPDLRYL